MINLMDLLSKFPNVGTVRSMGYIDVTGNGRRLVRLTPDGKVDYIYKSSIDLMGKEFSDKFIYYLKVNS